MHTRPGLLGILETYYDTAPRANATVEEVGPFTLFVKARPDAWDYYARPRLGYVGDITSAEVDTVRARQRELGAPENLEWVHETTPSLLDAVLSSGLPVDRCPLLVLDEEAVPVTPVASAALVADGIDVRVLEADDDLASAVAAVHAGFDGTDDAAPRAATRQAEMLREGLLGMAAAYDGRGTVVGGGSHGPRGATTELTGIAVLPRARRRGVGAAITAALVADARGRGVSTVFLSADDDTVARVYERVGFVRVGTACIAERD